MVNFLTIGGKFYDPTNEEELNKFIELKTNEILQNVDAYQITHIDEEDGIVSFLVNGGGEQVVLSVEDTEQEAAVSAKKIFRNGQIFIEMDGLYYDILGNRR